MARAHHAMIGLALEMLCVDWLSPDKKMLHAIGLVLGLGLLGLPRSNALTKVDAQKQGFTILPSEGEPHGRLHRVDFSD